MALPLAGVRVLDLTRVLAGPLCTMMLGDLGADVLKIERPDGGDETRGWGPPFDARGESAYYLAVNRNKRSLALDLDEARERDLLRALAAEADVVVDNFRPGTLERRGLDPLELLDAHPALVWCTLTGFGRDSRRPGYDFVVQAESGWMAITGETAGPPMKMGVALADVIAGKDAAVAILAALTGRKELRPVSERRIVVTLTHSATAALVNVAQNALVERRGAGPVGQRPPQSGALSIVRDCRPADRARGRQRSAVAGLLSRARARGPRGRRKARDQCREGAGPRARHERPSRPPSPRDLLRSGWNACRGTTFPSAWCGR